MFGKQVILDESLEMVNKTGIVIIQGGHRSGKSSLLKAVGSVLLRYIKVQTSIFVDLHDRSDQTPEQIIQEIQKDISYESKRKRRKKTKAFIAFDGIDSYSGQNQLTLLEEIAKLGMQGHKIAIAVNGDLHSQSSKELPAPAKDNLLSQTGNSVVINKLLDNDEMRELLSQGKEPIFTDLMSRFLINEAGGHPYLANALASTVIHLIKDRNFHPGSLNDELKKEIKRIGILNNFGLTIDLIIAAGFNPLTWEWTGKGDKPDTLVYQNMIPRYTSTIFRNWLTDYMRKKTKL